MIKLKNFYILKKEIKKIAVAFILAVFAAGGIGAAGAAKYSKKVQANIADSVIRFHCLANSNSKEDQDLKIKVRDCVLGELDMLMTGLETKEETKEIIISARELLKKAAEDEIKRNGMDYSVNINLGEFRFPLRNYGNVTFPAGKYEALRVEIGKAQGENFWCVMYPPLCFVDEACESIDEQTERKLQNVLPEEEFEIMCKGESEIRFKIVEWWQEKM